MTDLVEVASAGRPRSDTARRILDAALVRFADRGVEATSLDSLAAEIGVRKQTILYWFPSKDQLLLAVIDHAVADLGDRLTRAVLAAGPSIDQRLAAAVDATFRLGGTDPHLLALVREVARVGPPALTHLGRSLDPLVGSAADALVRTSPVPIDAGHARRVLVDAGARVVGMATEAEVRAQLGLPADVAWLRSRRRSLLADLGAALVGS